MARTTEEFRAAVVRGDWEEARDSLDRLCSEWEVACAQCTSAEERHRTARDIRNLLVWARTVTVACREHEQRRLLYRMSSNSYARLESSLRAEVSGN